MRGAVKWRSHCLLSLEAWIMISFLILLTCFLGVRDARTVAAAAIKAKVFSKEKSSSTANLVARNLLQSDEGGEGGDGGDANRIGTASCSKDDIVIFQGQMDYLPNGIPEFTVEILNMCPSGCSVGDIHVSCGGFSSARLVNPRIFRRIHYGDCLVNDGEALGPGQTISFQYADSFSYPLSVSSVAC